eukprot:16451872-Heterocapsa_arctica.AAC.1
MSRRAPGRGDMAAAQRLAPARRPQATGLSGDRETPTPRSDNLETRVIRRTQQAMNPLSCLLYTSDAADE